MPHRLIRITVTRLESKPCVGASLGECSEKIVEEFRHAAAVLTMFGHHLHHVPFVGASTDMSQPWCLVTKYYIEDQYGRGLTARQKEVLQGDSTSGFVNFHEGGFVHRDIAARNYLVDANNAPKLCDFGMCRQVSTNCGCTAGSARSSTKNGLPCASKKTRQSERQGPPRELVSQEQLERVFVRQVAGIPSIATSISTQQRLKVKCIGPRASSKRQRAIST
ncbi:hypothetical protein H310_05098 [Aphanomyces invadans]|uniref:Protein kinase domain-containing protein n=1 Tax=Aphanomyces invadans TaxID=157072 RepID=A0A024UBR7_9STRA|nr:hypothetical protein H310_05098 [Aphanomyces invadans]ETW03719.1 hypothetical protein H310_05098 [Aphanomyces invadans]|eukprot:XP_008867948.1 hypothetical protein H310_05098 [Aphanomyces invadans]